MGWLSKFFRQNRSSTNSERSSFTTRQGKTVPTDEVFWARSSGDIGRMLKAAALKTNPVDRHFLLQAIVAEAYKRRQDPTYRDLCAKHAELHLQEFPTLMGPLRNEVGGRLPQVSTFQQYATVLTEAGEFEKAIVVCEQAIKYGVQDGTKSGFKGRIDRIKKKAKASAR